MNHRKHNTRRWYTMGLACVLAVGCLIASAGTAFARYRVEFQEELQFMPRTLKFFHTGIVAEETVTDPDTQQTQTVEVFQTANTARWQYENGINTLTFAIANAAEAEDGTIRIPQEDQHLQIRFLGSLGLWNGSAPSAVTLTLKKTDMALAQTAELMSTEETEAAEPSTASEDPEEADQPQTQAETVPAEETVTVTAKAIHIREGSPLYDRFGAGWVFVFQDDRGQELTWTLEGGKQSYIEFTVCVAGGQITSTALAQMQIIGEPDL